MMNAIDNGAAKATAAKDRVKGTDLRQVLRVGVRALDPLLGVVGRARKPSALGAIGLFSSGFVVGSVATAFMTPLSGSALRKKVMAFVESVASESDSAPTPEDSEKKIDHNATPVVSDKSAMS